MSAVERFFDTNVILYLLSNDQRKADTAEQLLASGGVVSVQVLNEFASVATRKLTMTISEVREVLSAVRRACSVVPVSIEIHDLGLELMNSYALSVYDAMIAAAAIEAGCKFLYTEDLQDGQRLRGIVFRNPFVAG